MSDLVDLKANCVRESRTLEYKVQLALNGRDERKEFLSDVTALANTAGGDILVGVEETGGEPQAFPGLDIPDWDKLELQLASLIRDGTEPRLQGVTVRPVATPSGRCVIVIRVPRSHRRPHRVILGGHGHFYARDTAQKYRMDVEQLRSAFSQAVNIPEAIQQFRSERVRLIHTGHGFESVSSSARAILHLVPWRFLGPGNEFELSAVNFDANLRPLPRAALGYSQGVALEAVYLYNEQAYTAAFRSGVIEAVETLPLHKGQLFPTPLQLDVIEGTQRYLSFLDALGVDGPVSTLLTLTGVADVKFPVWSIDVMFRPRRAIGADHLELTGPILDSLDIDPADALRPLFDRLWNAFGYLRCEDYDETGAWNPRSRSIIA